MREDHRAAKLVRPPGDVLVQPLKTLIAANRYGTYCVPASSSHRPAAAAILNGEVWEEATLAFLTAHCAHGDVIHAGAYYGDFFPALSSALAPGAQVWAFEPGEENFRCAEITLKLNGITNVTLRRAALGAEAGNALLCTGSSGNAWGGASAIRASRKDGRDYEEVPVVAIDSIVPADRHVSIVQLDVEKYEQQALAGGLCTIRRCRPLIVLENIPADKSWFRETVVSLGYARIASVDRNLVFGPRSPRPERTA